MFFQMRLWIESELFASTKKTPPACLLFHGGGLDIQIRRNCYENSKHFRRASEINEKVENAHTTQNAKHPSPFFPISLEREREKIGGLNKGNGRREERRTHIISFLVYKTKGENQ